jgi:hypothetical protein
MAVESDRPQSVTFEVRVRRSIAGRATGASEVRIESLGLTAPIDPEGNFLFRSLPSGALTVVARIGGRTFSRTVTLPVEPTIMRDIDLGGLVANRAPSSPARPASNRSLVVQAGAFRKDRNARQLVDQLLSSGERPFAVATRGLTVVYIGPFETRQDALAARERLRRAGFDGLVTQR